jgi:uncharacterized protein YdiU (UPF0061 family)
VTTGEEVYREEVLPGAVLTRVAESHVRVGTFEYFSRRGDRESLKILVEYVCGRHGIGVGGDGRDSLWLLLLRYVCEKQAYLVSRWMLVGFIHGVLNTDNTSIVGETIDYGPCAFMDGYNPREVLSSIDRQGRYSYGSQPGIMSWNMARFAESLFLLVEEGGRGEMLERVNEEMEIFASRFHEHYREGLSAKLGLVGGREGDEDMCYDLWDMMMKGGSDFTMTFRDLSGVVLGDEGSEFDFLGHFGEERERAKTWLEGWKGRVGGEGIDCEERVSRMRSVNPLYIPRNHHVEEVIGSFRSGDGSLLREMCEAVSRPYEERSGYEKFATPPRPEERVKATFCGT